MAERPSDEVIVPARLHHVTLQTMRFEEVNHLAFEYDLIDDLMHTYLRLKELDIVPATVLNHGMTTSFYYLDPDGNYVELQVDNWDAEAKGSVAFMHTPEFLANPIGVPINPDSYVAAWRQGASVQELHKRAWAGEFVEGALPIFGGALLSPGNQ